MKTSRAALARLIADRMNGNDRLSPSHIAAYIMQEHRTLELESILRDVQKVRADEGCVEVIAESAHPLPEGAQAEIVAEARKHYPDASKIVVTEQHRPELLAGVRLRIIEYVLDLSARRALTRFNTLAVHGKDV